jgi:hypothetical protein
VEGNYDDRIPKVNVQEDHSFRFEGDSTNKILVVDFIVGTTNNRTFSELQGRLNSEII